MKKYLMFACVAALFAMTGCDDDGGGNDFKCKATVCSGNDLVICNADGSTKTEPCANGCDSANNKCNDSSSQAVKEGSPCTKDFVEHCDGSVAVFCSFASQEDYEANKPTVVHEDCSEYSELVEGVQYTFTCALTTEGGKPLANCIETTADIDICTAADEGKSALLCASDDGYLYQEEYVCRLFDDGKYHSVYYGASDCTTCTDGQICELVPCTEELYDDYDAKCTTDKKYVQYCEDYGDGEYYYVGFSCDEWDASCGEVTAQAGGRVDTPPPLRFSCSQNAFLPCQTF